MHNYPSDITREQFEIIRPDLEAAKRKTRPRKYDLYDIFCAVLYVLLGGMEEMLPIVVVIFKLLLSSLTQKVSKIRIQPKKKALTLVKKFPALNCSLLSIF